MSDNHSNQSQQNQTEDPAVNLIRSKINAIYGDEPSAKAEIKEVAQETGKLSKHQQYMKELTDSGKSMAEIQTAWHEYYQNLNDKEKHEVWQEFYKAHEKKAVHKPEPSPEPTAQHPPTTTHTYHEPKPTQKRAPKKSLQATKSHIRRTVKNRRKATATAKQNFKSLLFGLGLGAAVMVILLFSFFNERFITPFITPSRNVSSTPIIINPDSTAVGPETKVIIPKINVEVPVVYNVNSIQEKDIQTALENGVVHYATTPNPGEEGNGVIVGHSSNNLFNRGKYKFAFVLLNKLEEGDTFSLTKNGKRYVYRIYEKRIVSPTDVSVLGKTDKPATVTLITCDPPGTSINRLIVVGEQITPDPATNVASTARTANARPAIVPGNAPSLWSRLMEWLSG